MSDEMVSASEVLRDYPAPVIEYLCQKFNRDVRVLCRKNGQQPPARELTTEEFVQSAVAGTVFEAMELNMFYRFLRREGHIRDEAG